MPNSLLAEFGVRLVGGLAFSLLITPSKVVPLAFYRTQCLIILGLLVLAALDHSRLGGDRTTLAILTIGALAAYFASVGWGIGLPRVGSGLTALIAILMGLLIVVTERMATPGLALVDTAGRLASAFLLGSTLTAMLLGHHYLTAPSMSIDPLLRLIQVMSLALILRCLLSVLGLGLFCLKSSEAGSLTNLSSLFLAMRWGMGIVGGAVAVVLAWKTAKIRSTQSATGILYIAMTLVLFGELTALLLSREHGLLG